MSLRARQMAITAFDCVSKRAELGEDARRKYGALAHKLPGMILQNGLAQTTGFLLAKGKNGDHDPHSLLLDDLNAALNLPGQPTAAANRIALHERVLRADLTATLLLTRSALDAAGWLKRYVQGVLRIDATGDNAATPIDNAGAPR